MITDSFLVEAGKLTSTLGISWQKPGGKAKAASFSKLRSIIQTQSTPNMEPQDPFLHASSSFPIDPTEFDADDRISYSKLDNKFLLVQEDGTEFEFDDAIKRWIPVVDEALLEEQQRAYAMQGVDENEPVEAQRKKRKKEYVNGEDVGRILLLLCLPSVAFYTLLLQLVWVITDRALGEWTSRKSSQESETTSCAAAEHRCVCHWPPP